LIVTLVILALILVAAPATFAGINALDRRGWDDLIATGCANPADPATSGDGVCVGVLRIPALGDDWAVPIINGGGATGAVWVDGTTVPGEIGNFVLAGRRVGGGHPFRGVETLNSGDQVIVETATAVLTYVVDLAPRDVTVTEYDSWVLDPVPGAQDRVPQQALLTLLLRQDLWPTRDRSVGIAVLASSVAK
jgi:sortase A